MSEFIQELVHAGIYKRSQGRITRQVTFAALAITITIGLWRLSEMLGTWDPGFHLGLSPQAFQGLMKFGIPVLLLLAGLWTSYRLVNVPGFADFLIAVEAEMNKVSWPTRGDLSRASIVVLVVMFALAAILFAYDWLWRILLQLLRIY